MNTSSPDLDVRYVSNHFEYREQWVALAGGSDDPAYSIFKDILTSCLRFLPSNRPTFADVLRTIKERRPPGAQNSGVISDKFLASWASSFALNRSFVQADMDRMQAALLTIGNRNRTPDRPSASSLTPPLVI